MQITLRGSLLAHTVEVQPQLALLQKVFATVETLIIVISIEEITPHLMNLKEATLM